MCYVCCIRDWQVWRQNPAGSRTFSNLRSSAQTKTKQASVCARSRGVNKLGEDKEFPYSLERAPPLTGLRNSF